MKIFGIILSALFLSACGGGSSTPPVVTPPTTTYAISGQVQKGPFAIGSQIIVNELDVNLNATSKSYSAQTSDNLGNFTVSSAVTTNMVEIIGSGFYMDEITGKLGTSQIQLRGIADLSINTKPTVNVLTTLQQPRLKALIAQGKTYAVANTQSQNEVLAAFGINAAKITAISPFYSMKINGTTDSDSVLLAVSVTLSQMASNAAGINGSNQSAELSNYINTLAVELAATGTSSNAAFAAAKNAAQIAVNLPGVRSNLETYYANQTLTMAAPKFEEWIDKSGSGNLPQRLVPISELNFTNTLDTAPGQLITSNTVLISGLPEGFIAPVSASAGSTIIKNNVALAGLHADVKNGDTIALRLSTPGYGLSTMATISVGSSSATWGVTSKALGGGILGLTSAGLKLRNNGGEEIVVPSGATSFAFSTPLAMGASYNIILTGVPSPYLACTVINGVGTVSATAASISVYCAPVLSGITFDPVTSPVADTIVTSNTVTISGLGSGVSAEFKVRNIKASIIKNGVANGTTYTYDPPGPAVIIGWKTSVVDGDTIALTVPAPAHGASVSLEISIASSSGIWAVNTSIPYYTDTPYNLVWMPTSASATWAEANAFCTSFNGQGKTGWRQPTYLESNAIAERMGSLTPSQTMTNAQYYGWKEGSIWTSTADGVASHDVKWMGRSGGSAGMANSGPRADSTSQVISCVRANTP